MLCAEENDKRRVFKSWEREGSLPSCHTLTDGKSHLFLLLVWWLLCSSFAISLVIMRALPYIFSPLVCLLSPTLLSSFISIILTLSYASKPCSSYLALSSLWETVFFFSDSIEFFLCHCPHQMTDLLPLLMSPSNDGSSSFAHVPIKWRIFFLCSCPHQMTDLLFFISDSRSEHRETLSRNFSGRHFYQK